MKSYNEFCKIQAEKLFQVIDQFGGLLQWRKSWHVEGCSSLPKSIHGYYRGTNFWTLMFEQMQKGLVSDKWLMFNQVKQQNGVVLKGAKGTKVCFFKLKEIELDDPVEG